ncbi:dna-binding wrky domain-containing [Pyrenophora seminiperda CCB06]|uniref:Dna-binding wrky domain-containing n=1 Tax=Pyrenophora seminiperda CCB06 TaxID=1302712 RepID=A0A3M7LZA7_9PLEO|nr:dna-binding wrky domain-containing [Pyrenophora seminiperda CCB06]
MWSAHSHRDLGALAFGCAPAMVLPWAIAGGWPVWPLLAIWIGGYGLRWRNGDGRLTTDCTILGVCYAWLERGELVAIVPKSWNYTMGVLNGAEELSMARIATTVAVALTLSAAIYPWPRKMSTMDPRLEENEGKYHWRSGVEVPKARIFPCETKHARIFPKRHAFAYSYLQCGYPIIPTEHRHNGMVRFSGTDRSLGRWWLRVRAEDYLARGNDEHGFYWKLKTYLQEQHVKDSEWCYAYLVTAPRFLGYAFNPVSFWYIYDAEHQLKKMILEVNNTFGERRMYLLDGSSSPTSPTIPNSQPFPRAEEHEPQLPNGAKSKFTDVWMKDFHVSPFNSRKGSYSLKALNPFPFASYENPMIDNTITLKSSKDHGKLVARLYSTGKSFSPDHLGLFGTLRFVLSWWWVGFVTFPRIVREAGKLFFKRKLHVWFRPEVLTTSIGRLPSSTETTIYKVFALYLTTLVNQTSVPFRITLKTSIPEPVTNLITTCGEDTGNPRMRYIEIRVLTPGFYSRLVHYTYTSEAVDRECIFTDERNRTLWICRPQLLPLLLSERSSIQINEQGVRAVPRTYLDELRWLLLKKLRCAPADPAYSVTPKSTTSTVNDIRHRPYSELDKFVRSVGGQPYAGEYRRAVTKLFLAQRFCFGFSEVVGLVDLVLRVSFCLLAVLQLRKWSELGERSGPGDCLKLLLTQRNVSACFGAHRFSSWDWWWMAKSAASMYACHAYGLLKGYK